MRLASLWTISRRSVLLWIGTLFLILGLAFLTIGVRAFLEDHAYKTQGLDVQAVVLDKTLVRANRQNNARTQYPVTYRFTPRMAKRSMGQRTCPSRNGNGWSRARHFR